jgi:signal transduction histidine kinase
MKVKDQPTPPLSRLLPLRLAQTALVCLLLQTLWVVWTYHSNPDELHEDAVERVLDTALHALERHGDLSLVPSGDVGYARISLALLDRQGALLLARGDARPDSAILTAGTREAFLESGLETAPVWQGLRRVLIAGEPRLLWTRIDFKAGKYPLPILLAETLEDMAYPLAPAMLMLLLANILATRWSLRGLTRVAAAAQEIGGRTIDGTRLDGNGLPREVRQLVDAVNGGLERLDRALERQRAFNADAAHELRTPLATLSLELERVPDPLGENLRRDVQCLARRVEQLLDMARLGALEIGPADRVAPDELAAHLVGRCAPLAIRAGRQLEFSTEGRPLSLRGNEAAVEGALLNLIDNALKATPPGGRVTVIAGPGACLQVADHGPGIPAAMVERMFDRHWQADRSKRTGVGLGLAIVAQTMAAHGGNVSVTSRGDGQKGAVIRLHFQPADNGDDVP